MGENVNENTLPTYLYFSGFYYKEQLKPVML